MLRFFRKNTPNKKYFRLPTKLINTNYFKQPNLSKAMSHLKNTGVKRNKNSEGKY